MLFHIVFKESLKIVELKMAIYESADTFWDIFGSDDFKKSADAGGHLKGLSPQFTDDGVQHYPITNEQAIRKVKKMFEIEPCTKKVFVEMGVWDAEKETLSRFTLDTFSQLGERVYKLIFRPAGNREESNSSM